MFFVNDKTFIQFSGISSDRGFDHMPVSLVFSSMVLVCNLPFLISYLKVNNSKKRVFYFCAVVVSASGCLTMVAGVHAGVRVCEAPSECPGRVSARPWHWRCSVAWCPEHWGEAMRREQRTGPGGRRAFPPLCHGSRGL